MANRTLWTGNIDPKTKEATLVGDRYEVLIDDEAVQRLVLKAHGSKGKQAKDGPLTVRFPKNPPFSR